MLEMVDAPNMLSIPLYGLDMRIPVIQIRTENTRLSTTRQMILGLRCGENSTSSYSIIEVWPGGHSNTIQLGYDTVVP